MARRNILDRVIVCRPLHINVCLRHQLWIGDIHSLDDQLDIRSLPEIASSASTPGSSAATEPKPPIAPTATRTKSSDGGPNGATGLSTAIAA
jgi:hypothetical protein